MSELITVRQAAGILGVTYQEADRLTREPKGRAALPVVDRVGNVRRVSRAAVLARRDAKPGRGRPPAIASSIAAHHGQPCADCLAAQESEQDDEPGSMDAMRAAAEEERELIWLFHRDQPVFEWSGNPGHMLCAFHAEPVDGSEPADYIAAWNEFWAVRNPAWRLQRELDALSQPPAGGA